MTCIPHCDRSFFIQLLEVFKKRSERYGMPLKRSRLAASGFEPLVEHFAYLLKYHKNSN
jgi:hypothetical protein